MNVAGFVEEVVTAPYYRRRPREIVRYASAMRLFDRYRMEEPSELLVTLGINPREALEDFERWCPLLEGVVAKVAPDLDHQGGISIEDGQILYGIVRALRPEYVIETGMAAGVSSSFICAAMIDNGHGRLYSLDLPPGESAGHVHADGSAFGRARRGIGWAMPEEILQRMGDRRGVIIRDVRESLPDLLSRLAHVDVFFNDDLHTPNHMRWAFELVWPRLRSGGILVADDVNASWVEFCRAHKLPRAAFQNIQRLAAVRKP